MQERTLQIAKDTKFELAATKRAEALSKIAHSKELKQLEQERDEAKEKYQILLSSTAAAATTPAVVAAASVTTVAERTSPGDIAMQEDNTRLTLALRSQSSLLSKKSSELDRMQSLLRTRSNHSALQLKTATSTITSLEEDKAKAEARIAELERDVQEVNEKAEEMEEMYMAVALASEGEGQNEEEEKEEDEEEGSGGEKAEKSWLLKQIVEMSKKGQKEPGSTTEWSGADGSGSEDEKEEDEEDNDEDDKDDDNDGEEDGGDKEEKQIHDKNEDLLKDMMGRP